MEKKHVCNGDCLQKYVELVDEGDQEKIDSYIKDHNTVVMVAYFMSDFDSQEEWDQYLSEK